MNVYFLMHEYIFNFFGEGGYPNNVVFSSALTDKGKFLLAARRYRRASHIEYIISLHDDYSQRSNSYVGKLRSDCKLVLDCKKTVILPIYLIAS